MIEETALIVEIEDQFAWLETRRKSACSACAVNKGCGTAVLSKVLGKRTARVKALNRAGAHVGDEVIVGIEENALVRGSLAVYIVPLIGMFCMGFLGELMAEQLGLEQTEVASIIFGLLGLFIGIRWLRYFGQRISNSSDYQPVVLRRSSDTIQLNT